MNVTTVEQMTGSVIVGATQTGEEVVVKTVPMTIKNVIVIDYNAMGVTLIGQIDDGQIEGITHVIAKGVDYEIGDKIEDHYVMADSLGKALWAPLSSLMKIEKPSEDAIVKNHEVVQAAIIGWAVQS